MSDHCKKALENYKAGYWNKAMLRNLVKKGYITQDEYDFIIAQ